MLTQCPLRAVFVFRPSEPRPLFTQKAVCSGKVQRSVFAPRDEPLDSCDEKTQWLNRSRLYFLTDNMVHVLNSTLHTLYTFIFVILVDEINAWVHLCGSVESMLTSPWFSPQDLLTFSTRTEDERILSSRKQVSVLSAHSLSPDLQITSKDPGISFALDIAVFKGKAGVS